MLKNPRTQSVEEFHGPYGPYQVSELVLQKIWLEQAFDTERLTDDRGRSIRVVHPGTWNRLEGPDFKGAILEVEGEEQRGDVEVHFSQSDWKAHGHHEDGAYEDVILHILYHNPPNSSSVAEDRLGRRLPFVCLLPLLWYSLEEYAGEDSLIASTGVDLRPEVESLLRFDLEIRKQRLVEFARRRWEMKCHYAALRIEQLGWVSACHQTALEVMGYARNRAPMLRIAERYPLRRFIGESPSVEDLLLAGGEGWRLGGCRPANQPRLRLKQYSDMVTARGCWPALLREEFDFGELSTASPLKEDWGTAVARSDLGVAEMRNRFKGDVFGKRLVGAKADTLVCDGLLPLLSAGRGLKLFPLWFHWNAGNGPASTSEALRVLQVLEPRRVPMSNGWLQGILGMKNEEFRGASGSGRFQAHA
ncbi:DUF2851 family protein [Pelagicoccus albus]|uniref:DUF2851 family protein n=1 Tax=Pelagicoccus albus TaxID=415222 RepID=A0A7X1B665_9BACT|nr:DUF2851 family protein [Pelagicoccus albus]MBC2605115.1 DUF2851 family protein [Pelagicoccus albus]